MSQTTMTSRDLDQMLAVTRSYPADSGEGLPWELLHDLRALVPCDHLSVSGQDTPQWHFFVDQELPRIDWPAAEREGYEAAYRTHYWDSTCSIYDRTGDTTIVARDSDLETSAERARSGMAADYSLPADARHEIVVCLEAGGPQRTVRLLFTRGPGPDFSDRDVAVLTLLRPHLQGAFLAAERRRRGISPLTPRQQEVLRYVAAGYGNGQIARRMKLSEATVRKHLENIFGRLDVGTRAAAVARAGDVLPVPAVVPD